MYRFLFYLFLFQMLWGCGDQQLDEELRHLIRYHQLTGDPVTDPKKQISDINSKKAQLGKLLFFSKSLSGNKDVACASCHHPFIGGDDDLSLSIGVNPLESDIVGKLRENVSKDILVPRNAPTTFNSSLWKKSLFHDGRIERLNAFDASVAKISTPDEDFGDVDPTAISLLQAQAGFPVTSEHEMRDNYLKKSSNNRLRQDLVRNIIESSKSRDKAKMNWEKLFREVYSDQPKPITTLITFDRITQLLAEYQRSQVFINTPWRKFVEGDNDAISAEAKRGALIFYKSVEDGGADCVSCHKGDFFTDENFHIIAVPQIGFGKELSGDDRGRYLRTGILDDRYAFRTPSLINVEHTAPYGHDGAYGSLEGIVRHHLDPETSVNTYDFSLKELDQNYIQTDKARLLSQKALKAFKRKVKDGKSKLIKNKLMEDDIVAIIEFLKALTDPCLTNRDCLNKWVPQKGGKNPDGLILYAY